MEAPPHQSLKRIRSLLSRRTIRALGSGVLLLAVCSPAEAQFNARGRRPPKSAGPAKPPTSRTPRQNNSPKRQRPSLPSKQSGGGITDAERQNQLIIRYRNLIITQPGEEVPLHRLTQLVRGRDGNLEKLLDELESQADSADDKYPVLVAWAGILALDNQKEAALTHLHTAVEIHPKRPEARLLLASIYEAVGKPKEARTHLAQASSTQTGTGRDLSLRTLRSLSLDLKDYTAAEKYHRILVQASHGNLYLQGELGRQLLERGLTERAIVELRKVVKNVGSDSRALAPVMRDLGEAQIAAKHYQDAIKTLEQASEHALKSPGLRLAIDRLTAKAHRKNHTMGEYLVFLEKTARSSTRLALLAQLYEEEGKPTKALHYYKKALQRDSTNADLRLHLVRLYELSGDLKSALAQYKTLLKRLPRELGLSIRYMDLLLAQGEREAMLIEFDRINRVTQKDPEAGLLLLDLAERLDERERAKRLLKRLALYRGGDAEYLVELGSRFYMTGDKEAAKNTWQRILIVERNKSRAFTMYGEVLIDHEDEHEGLIALREAVRLSPKSWRAHRALALGLERTAALGNRSQGQALEKEALNHWLTLLAIYSATELKQAQAALSKGKREQGLNQARRHIVRLWKRRGELQSHLPVLQKRMKGSPPDLNAGRLLVETYLSERMYDEAIVQLRILLKHEPGNVAVLTLLESTYGRLGRYEDALLVSEKLVRADPTRARHYYDQMARTASKQGAPKRALEYAQLSAERSPSDPQAQAQLGDLFLAQGQEEKAETAYRAALAKDDRLFQVSLSLSGILATTGRMPEALDLLFHVIAQSRVVDEIRLAASRALSLSVTSGNIRAVEDVLRPLALSRSNQKLFRSLLVDVLSTQFYPLVQTTLHGQPDAQIEAQKELVRLSDRSTGPLLAALVKDDSRETRFAIELLGYGSTPAAANALLAFSVGTAHQDLRLLSVLALGRLKSDETADKLFPLLFNDEQVRRDKVALAALWVLAQSENPKKIQLLLRCLKEGTPDIRAYAALGIADSGGLSSSEKKQSVSTLQMVISSQRSGDVVRAAAALALGRLSQARSAYVHSSKRELQDASESSSGLLARAALIALAESSNDEGSDDVFARALVSEVETLRTTAERATSVLMASALSREKIREPSPPELNFPPLIPTTLSPTNLSSRQLIERLLEAIPVEELPSSYLLELKATALIRLGPVFTEEARFALRSSKAARLAVLEQLQPTSSNAFVGAFLISRTRAGNETYKQAQETARNILTELQPELLELAESTDTQLAQGALRLLSCDDSPASLSLLQAALKRPEAGVEQAALVSLQRSDSQVALDVLSRQIDSKIHWSKRRRATEAVGLLYQATELQSLKTNARQLLEKIATDKSALVRQEAQHHLEIAQNGSSILRE